jgi:tetratricopeptide (TPR) repeat protein
VPVLSRLLSRSLLAISLSIVSIGIGTAATTSSPKGPSTAGAYLAGTQALFDLRTGDAARFFREALSGDAENPMVIERGFISFAANGDIEEAAEAARRLLPFAPKNDLAKLVIATVELKERRYDSAISELDGVEHESFAGITAGVLRAWAYTGAGRHEEAEALLSEIGAAGLEDFLVFHRALMDEVAGQTDAAIENAAKAYEADPFVARIVEAYARILANAGRMDEARAVIDRFDAEGFTHPLIELVRGDLDDNRAPGPFATTVQVGAAEMFHGIGVALARERSTDVALVFLRLGLYLDPRADVIALVVGQLLDTAGQHTAANLIYDNVPATSPMKPTAVVRVAENLDAMGNREEALRRLGNIVRANPDDLDALSVLGDLQRTDERYAEAAESYSRALDLTPGDQPGDWRFYYVRGIAYERNKEWPKAEADFQKALELRPDQPQVLNYLGYSWVDQGINLDPALDMIERAVAAAPNDGYIIDSLGWAFYRLGRFDDAVEQLERAVLLRPNDPEINDHLGDAYWEAGRQLEAKFQWRIAAAVAGDEGNVAERVVAKLEREIILPEDEPVAEVPAVAAVEERAAAEVKQEVAILPGAPVVETTQPAEGSAPPVETATAPEPAATPEPRTITIAPGDNLWTIAREAYGMGAEYTRIVEANPDKLRNPARIQPGLVLVLPDAP